MEYLNTKHLVLGYDQQPIITDLDITLLTGSITAMVGANGCGKSTLLRGLSRLLKPRGGQVILNGQNIWQLPTKELAKQMGILPQSPTAPEGLTVYELVAQGRYPHQGWLQQWSKEDEEITLTALADTNLMDLADRAVDTLSGGQRQRAWIAMTLAQDTDWLLLDEPTTFLDVAYQIEILDLLVELNQSRGKSVVMVLHDLNHAARYADQIVALAGGLVIAQGSPHDVITPELVHEVFGIHSHIIPCPVSGAPLVIPTSEKSKPSATVITPVFEQNVTAYPVNGQAIKEYA